MHKYYEVLVHQTSKPVGSKEPNGEGYSLFNSETKGFNTIKEVKDYLQEQYQKCKREKMYIDKNGKSQHVGYIYSFKNSDISHPWNEDGSDNKWYQRDWVQVKECKSKTIIIN